MKEAIGRSTVLHHPVIVIGSGPTGLVLANLLGRADVDVLLVERHAATVTEPRAVSIDDESLRTIQATGAIDVVLAGIVPGYGSHYHGPNGKCFAKVEPTGAPFGYPRRNAFRQPLLEQQLRDNLGGSTSVTTRFGWRLSGFQDQGDRVEATLLDPAGMAHTLTCDYLVGCDGASSSVRDGLGIILGGTTFDERWLIVDLEHSPDDGKHTKVFCDTRRPCITLPGPAQTRRFEFKLLPGERDEDLLRSDVVARLLATHDADPAATIRRKVVYHFHARVADRWSSGRIFLAGDAAHLTPPFAGQGMNSGIRDAHNLAWKLTSVLCGQTGPGLLDSYAEERRDHVWAMIRLALRMGKVMSPPNRLAGWATRALFTALRLWPAASDYVLQMKYKPKPRFAKGFLLPGGGDLVGRLFPQPRVLDGEGEQTLMDEVTGLTFCLLAYTTDPARVFRALNHPVWTALAATRLAVLPPGSRPVAEPGVTVVTDTTGEVGRAMAASDATILLMRPDHYIASAFSLAEADRAASALQAMLAATWPDQPATVQPHPSELATVTAPR